MSRRLFSCEENEVIGSVLAGAWVESSQGGPQKVLLPKSYPQTLRKCPAGTQVRAFFSRKLSAPRLIRVGSKYASPVKVTSGRILRMSVYMELRSSSC